MFILTVALIGVAALRLPRPWTEPSIPRSDGAIELAPENALVLTTSLIRAGTLR